jgi:DNA-binding response OmpR family regulator
MHNSQITVSIVEDEAVLRQEMAFQLKHLGFDVQTFENAEQFYRYLVGHPKTIVVLDIALDGEDGLSICRHLRTTNAAMGIVFVTARGMREDRMVGLQAEADAYMTKPVDIDELALILRRLASRLVVVAADTKIPVLETKLLDWHMEADSSFVIAPNGVRVRLSVNEAQLLRVLLKQPGTICSHVELGMALGLTVDEIDKHRIEVILSRLKSKVARSAGVPLAIQSERGIGYSLTF